MRHYFGMIDADGIDASTSINIAPIKAALPVDGLLNSNHHHHR
jgi:hypothetical protein